MIDLLEGSLIKTKRNLIGVIYLVLVLYVACSELSCTATPTIVSEKTLTSFTKTHSPIKTRTIPTSTSTATATFTFSPQPTTTKSPLGDFILVQQEEGGEVYIQRSWFEEYDNSLNIKAKFLDWSESGCGFYGLVENIDNNLSVVTMGLDGEIQEEIVSFSNVEKIIGSRIGGSEFYYTISPDHQFLTFPVFDEQIQPNHQVLYIYEIRSGNFWKITTNSWGFLPSWSPDSQRLAFFEESDSSYDLMVYDMPSRAVVQVLFLPKFDLGEFEPFPLKINWSPDGTGFTYTYNDEQHGASVFYYNLETRQNQLISDQLWMSWGDNQIVLLENADGLFFLNPLNKQENLFLSSSAEEWKAGWYLPKFLPDGEWVAMFDYTIHFPPAFTMVNVRTHAKHSFVNILMKDTAIYDWQFNWAKCKP